MKIGIIGFGFVGNALKNGLKRNVETFIVDPKIDTRIESLIEFSPDIIFICVPTPMNDDGTQNIQILNNVISELKSIDLDSTLVIKSTVLPHHLLSINELLPRVIYNPEFLRESNADNDFINSDLIIFGGTKSETKKIEDFYNNYTNCLTKEYHHTDIVSASIIKYSINTYLSLKVIFFNELKDLHSKSGTNESWDNFIKILSADKRIGSSHMQVPGPDGKLGFGGACFPKDLNAFIKYSETIGSELKILKKTQEINNIIRSEYNEIDEREASQNINFEKKP